MGYYVHELPGRMRIKIPGLKGNLEEAQRMMAFLKQIPGVKTTSFNEITGSTVVIYDEQSVNTKTILTMLTIEGFIDIADALGLGKDGKMGNAAAKALVGFALDRAFQGSPLSLLTALI